MGTSKIYPGVEIYSVFNSSCKNHVYAYTVKMLLLWELELFPRQFKIALHELLCNKPFLIAAAAMNNCCVTSIQITHEHSTVYNNNNCKVIWRIFVKFCCTMSEQWLDCTGVCVCIYIYIPVYIYIYMFFAFTFLTTAAPTRLRLAKVNKYYLFFETLAFPLRSQ